MRQASATLLSTAREKGGYQWEISDRLRVDLRGVHPECLSRRFSIATHNSHEISLSRIVRLVQRLK